MLLAGLGFPIPLYLLHKKYPKFGFDKVFTPILVGESLISFSLEARHPDRANFYS